MISAQARLKKKKQKQNFRSVNTNFIFYVNVMFTFEEKYKIISLVSMWTHCSSTFL